MVVENEIVASSWKVKARGTKTGIYGLCVLVKVVAHKPREPAVEGVSFAYDNLNCY